MSSSSIQPYSYERIESIAKSIKEKVSVNPKVGIICGSGLGCLADQLKNPEVIKYDAIPDFPKTTVAGHFGSLVFGYFDHVPVVCMKGRFHCYEGHPAWLCAVPIRVLKLLGIELAIITNAAGGLNPKFKAGDVMIIEDHIGLPSMTGSSPLVGLNEERWGPRFPSLSSAYDRELIKLVELCGERLKIDSFMRKGVYCMSYGPSYETIAECKMLHSMGADAVGMSTVPEVTVACHAKLKIVGLSLITNMCVMDRNGKVETSHQEVLEMANMRAKDMERLVREVIVNYYPKSKERIVRIKSQGS